ncbi:MSMEG_4193 family putative phosphomutase [Embleya sp. NBC_00896]|uniref:MSMEG_4193 family putative phosphomutase n=1 Tax=Embleya sp. NBC_00896 TaxID=2975961 RepID=UPI00386E1365|nr:MSMEG_4193 family putative phosphomutase [Embleya sp. NBC_00896]
MTTVLFVRHGRTTANSSGILAGWAPGVLLDDRGEEQAAALAARIAEVPLAAVVTSPLERCRQTSEAILAARLGTKLALDAGAQVDERVGECRYGDWTGRELKELAGESLWKTVQNHPSAVTFPGPGGEALRTTQARAVDAVREWNERITAEHGPDAMYLVCSHGDVIKALVADALGMHLDLFQRIQVDPCSLTVVSYGGQRPSVGRLNDTGGSVAGLLPPPDGRHASASDDAVVGGGAGAP